MRPERFELPAYWFVGLGFENLNAFIFFLVWPSNVPIGEDAIQAAHNLSKIPAKDPRRHGLILCAQRLRFPSFKNHQFVEREGIQNMTLWCEPERLVGGR